MPLSDHYLSSALMSFSTFLAMISISESEKKSAQELFRAIMAKKDQSDIWSVNDVDRFGSLHQAYQPAVIATVRQFIEKHPPFQVSVYLQEFLLALAADGCSGSTVRNYRSDINQFWLFAQTTDLDRLLNKTKISDFIANEQAKGLQSSSIRRKVAAISQFGLWAHRNSLSKNDLGWLANPHLLEELQASSNFQKPPIQKSTQAISTPISSLLSNQNSPTPASLPIQTPIHPTARKNQEHRAELREQLAELSVRIRKQSQQLITPWLTIAAIGLFFLGLTIFGYQQLFLDAPQPLAYPSTPVTPNRVLSFQGRLTDTAQNPLTTATNINFKLFDAVTVGTELWTSGTCSITPDQDGIFNTALGSTCGSAIPATVFSERANVWLEISVAAETLTPRQPIWTVPYALNSETIQGYPINASGAATVNTVVTMNAAGDIVLGEVGPEIRSVSGEFTITGQSLLLQTQSNGNIILDANGTGGTFVRDYLSAPAATLSATYAAGVPLTVRGGPSGTGNVLNLQDSAGTGLTVFDSAGNLAIGATTTAVKLTVRDTANSSTLGASNSLRLYGGTVLGARTEVGFGYAAGTNVPAVIGFVNADASSNTNGDLYFGTRSVTTDTAVTERMRITASGNVGVGGDTTPDSLFSVGSSSQFQVNSSGAIAAATGLTSSGAITFSGLNTAGGVVYTNTSGVLGTVAGSSGQCLISNGSSAPIWSACTAGGAGSSKWNITAGALVPVNSTLDVLVGGTATASARAGFLNINSGTPTATVSAGTAGGTYLTAAGTLQSTANQALTIGGNTTGDITLSPLNGSGRVTSTGDFSLSSGKAYLINGTSVLNATTLGTSVVTSSLTTVGALNAGTITSGFGTIDNADTITGTTLNGTTGINTGASAGTQRIDASGNLVNIGNITATGTLQNTGATTLSGGAVNINASSNFAINIGTGTTTGTITLGGAGAQTLDIGNGAAVKTVNLGSATTTSTTTILGGVSGSLNLNVNNAGAVTNIGTGTTTGAITLGGGSNDVIINSDTWDVSSGGAITGLTGVTSSGTITFSGLNTAGGVVYTDSSGVLGTVAGSSGQCLNSNGTSAPSWGSCLAGAINYWRLANGAFSPVNDTADLLVGSNASSSAKFAILNVNSGTPTASVSAGTAGGAFLTATGTLSTTARQTLTIGNSSTFNTSGNTLINSNGVGLVGIGTTNPGWTLDVAGSASINNNLLTQIEGGQLYGRTIVSQNKFTMDDTSFGVTWTARDSTRSWLDVAMSADGKYQTTTVNAGTLYTSTDYGVTWTSRDSIRAWYYAEISADGKYQTATVYGGTLYTSSDYGVTWTSRDSSRNWNGIAMSSDGKYQTASNEAGTLYTSSDYGVTWTSRDSSRNWNGIAMSSDGKYQTASGGSSNTLYTSYDYGVTWTSRDSIRVWSNVAMSSDGKYQTAGVFGGTLYTSTDYGVTWTTRESSRSWRSVTISSDGKYQAATAGGGTIYTSTNYGVTWTSRDSIRNWYGIAMSSDGTYVTAVVNGSTLYTSNAATQLTAGQLILNTLNGGDLFTASASGTTRFRIDTSGQVLGSQFSDLQNSTYYLDPAGSISLITAGSVGIGGDTTPDSLFSVGSTSQFQINTSGAVVAGSITSGFGTIDNADTITGTTLNGTTGINTGASAGTQRIDASGNLVNIGNITATGTLQNTGATTLSGGAVNINASSNFAINIGTGTTTGTITLGGAGAQTLDIGNGAAVKTVNLGSATTTSTTTILGGVSGSLNLNVNNAGAVTNIGTGTTTGAITLGGGSGTVAVNSTTWDISTTGAATGFISITSSGLISSTLSGGKYFQGGDDASFNDIDVANTVGLYGVQNTAVGSLKLGSGGGIISGSGGNIGINTLVPGAKLQINSEIAHTYPTPGLTKGSLHINPAGINDNSASITFGANSSGNLSDLAQAGIYVQSSDAYGTKMSFATTDSYATGSKTRMLIDNLGNVGIGTTTPSALFSVGSTSQFQVNASGTVTAGSITITNDTGSLTVGRQDNVNEGGQITIAGASTYDPWVVDSYQNTIRLFSNSANSNVFQVFNNGAGVANLSVEGYVEAKSGTAAAPSFSFSGDANTGMYSTTDVVKFSAGGVNAVNANIYGLQIDDVNDGHSCTTTYKGTLVYDRNSGEDGQLWICYETSTGTFDWGNLGRGSNATNPDLAEYAWANDVSLNGGDLVAVTSASDFRQDFYDRFDITRATPTGAHKMIGVVSSDPGIILNKPESSILGTPVDPRLKPLTLAGRVPVKIITSAPLTQGDRIGLSADLAGIGSKLTGSGFSVGTVLTDFDPTTANCTTIANPTQANWSNDNVDTCFRLPDGRVLTKVLILVNNEFSIGDSDLAAALKNGQNWNLDTLGDLSLQPLSQTNYQVATQTGSLITDLVAYTQAVIGNLRVGFLTAQNIVTTRLSATQKIETPELATNLISPLGAGDLTIKLNSSTASTAATAVTIANEQNQVVTKIDGDGNITLAGQLLADQVTTATLSAETADLTSARITQLESNLATLEKIRANTAEIVTATISGTLYADEIYNFQDKVATALQEPSLLAQLLGQVPQASSSTSVTTLTQFIDQTAAFASGSATLNKSLADLNLAEEDVVLGSAALFVNNYFELNGSGYIADSLGIGNSLLVGQGTTIADGRIEYISSSDPSTTILQIQPSGFGQINFLAGLMTLSDTGQVVINGDLEVAGTLKTKTLLTNLVTAADFTNPLQVQVAGVSTESAEVQESRFEIINELGTPVATISARGRAEFAGGIGVGAEDISGALGEPTTTKTSGKAMVLANTNDVTIKSTLLTEKSLLYVTPVGSTGNQVLYVKSQIVDDPLTLENEGAFVVGFDGQTTQNVQFNWWIVN